MEDWIKPGASVTFVEKKIIKSDHHPGAESDSENDSDDDVSGSNNAKDDNIVEMKVDKKIIGPPENDKTCDEQLPKMDVDNISTSPETNKMDGSKEGNEAMEED